MDAVLKRVKKALQRAQKHRLAGRMRQAMFWIGGAIQIGLLASDLWEADLLDEKEYLAIQSRLNRARLLWDTISEESEPGSTKGNPALTHAEIEAFEDYLEENAML
jgi:hypothetical protein